MVAAPSHRPVAEAPCRRLVQAGPASAGFGRGRRRPVRRAPHHPQPFAVGGVWAADEHAAGLVAAAEARLGRGVRRRVVADAVRKNDILAGLAHAPAGGHMGGWAGGQAGSGRRASSIARSGKPRGRQMPRAAHSSLCQPGQHEVGLSHRCRACHAAPCCAMTCHAVPCCAMPCHAVPCCAMPGQAAPQLAAGGHGLLAALGRGLDKVKHYVLGVSAGVGAVQVVGGEFHCCRGRAGGGKKGGFLCRVPDTMHSLHAREAPSLFCGFWLHCAGRERSAVGLRIPQRTRPGFFLPAQQP